MTNVNIAPLQTLLERDIAPDELAEKIESVVLGYAVYALRDESLCGAPEIADQLLYLSDLARTLRMSNGL